MSRALAIAIAIAAGCVPSANVHVYALPGLAEIPAAPEPTEPDPDDPTPPVAPPPRPELSVDLWFDTRPEQRTRDVAVIEVYSFTLADGLRALRRQAAYSGCDGLIVNPMQSAHTRMYVTATCVAYIK